MTPLEVLKGIVENNYSEDLGTYDFDGIAGDVFIKIEELDDEQPTI